MPLTPARLLLLPVLAYAAVGLCVSLVAHVSALLGFALGGQGLFEALHIGIFPLWFVVVVLAQRIAGGTRRRDFWKVMLSGCPDWMRYMTYGFFVYAIANFVIFIATMPQGPQAHGTSSTMWRGFSGHWMVFYSAGLAMATTVYRWGSLGPRRCPYGHEVGYGDRYCPACGVEIGAPDAISRQ